MKSIRQFIRHPADIPVECELVRGNSQCKVLRDVSLGGLSFQCARHMEVGSLVDVRIPLVAPDYQIHCRVVWCRRISEAYYHAGVAFLDREDAYRGRMIEQICHIEHYKREVLNTQGRELTSEEAAREWVSKYAHVFPTVEKPD